MALPLAEGTTGTGQPPLGSVLGWWAQPAHLCVNPPLPGPGSLSCPTVDMALLTEGRAAGTDRGGTCGPSPGQAHSQDAPSPQPGPSSDQMLGLCDPQTPLEPRDASGQMGG